MSKQAAPLRESTYCILASLRSGPLYGYGIIQRAAELSGGRVHLAAGTLYPALDQLTEEGYVSRAAKETVAGHVRRAYGLTAAGLIAMHAEAERIEQASRVVSAGGRRAAVGGIVVVGGRVRVGSRAGKA